MNKIKVLLVEDHTILRKGIKALLEKETRIEVIGEAEDGIEAMKAIRKSQPDIVLLDISLPYLNGLEITRKILKHYPKIKVLILTMHSSEEYVNELLTAGAKGYIIKQAAPDELISAIRSVSEGFIYLSPEISKKVAGRTNLIGRLNKDKKDRLQLSERETEVLQLIVEEHSPRDIAGLLFISIKTVENHRYNIMKKLDIHSIAGLTKYALEKKIIQL